MASAIPYIIKFAPIVLSAVGAMKQGNDANSADQFNAAQRRIEGQAALDQSTQQEAQQRQSSREALGKQAAAVGAAGIGYGGSSAKVMDQSAINAELDALHIRYRGQFTNYGYQAEANALEAEGRKKKQSGWISAAGSILQGVGSYYGSKTTGSGLG